MKKLLALAAASFSLFSVATAKEETLQLVSIDGMVLMQKSKEGQAVTKRIQKEVDTYQAFVQGSQKELAQMQEEIRKQADVLSPEKLQEKTEQLNTKKKSLERTMADKEESLRAIIQKEQTRLRSKQLEIASKVFEENKWGMLVDKNAPGVLFVSKAIDKTDDVLRKVDEDYEKSEKSAVSKKSVAKKEIKTA